MNFYKDLLGKELLQRCKVRNVIIDEGAKRTDEQHSLLDCNFNRSDVKIVLWLIPNDKAPGLMGLIVSF